MSEVLKKWSPEETTWKTKQTTCVFCNFLWCSTFFCSKLFSRWIYSIVFARACLCSFGVCVFVCVLIPDWAGNPALCQLGWLMGSSWQSDGMRVRSAGGLPHQSPTHRLALIQTHTQTQIYSPCSDRHVSHSNNPVKLPFLLHGFFLFPLDMSSSWCSLFTPLFFFSATTFLHSALFFLHKVCTCI